ncbi:MAG: tetratricopeptide repeat protein [Candidatus Omnitrophota bacterium]
MVSIRRFFIIFILLFIFIEIQNIRSLHSFAQNLPQEEKDFFVAQKAFEDGFYDTSLNLFEEFLIDYPYSNQKLAVSLYIAKSLFFQKRYQESLDKFQRIMGIAEANTIRDEILYWIAETYFKTRDYKNASYYYQKLIFEFPQSKYRADAYYSNGFCAYINDNYKDAINIFTYIKEQFPDSPLSQEASFKIIESFYNLKDFKNLSLSINEFLEIYSKSKKLNYIYYYRAELNYYLGNLSDAVRDFNLCLNINQGDEFLESCSNLGLGWIYLKNEKFDDADKAFAKVNKEILEQKNKESLILGRAVLYSKTQKVDEAKDLFDSLIIGSKDNNVLFEAYVAKGELLYNSSRFNEAVSVYRDALKKFSDKSSFDLDKLYYGLAWVYLKLGNFKDAITEFQKVIKESSNKVIKVSALCQLADTYQDQGDFDEAIEKYDKILKDYPDNFYSDYVQYQLGVALLKSEKYDSAILAFSKLISDFPNSKLRDSGLYSLGLTYFKEGDFLKSKECFLSLYQDFPDSKLRYEALYLAGISFYNQSNFTEAIRIFKNLLKEKKLDNDLLVKTEYELADCYLRLSDEKEALRRFRALNARYPDSFLADDVLFWLGEYFLKELKFSFARRYFFSLIEKYPKSPLISESYYNIGYSYVQEGNLDEAKKIFIKLKADYRDKNSVLAQIALIDIKAEEGKTKEAVQEYSRLLEYNSEFSKLIYLKLADVYRKQNNTDKAMEIYRKLQDQVVDPYIEFQIAECFEEKEDFSSAIKEYLSISYSYSDDRVLVLKSLLRAAKLFEEKEEWLQAKNIYNKISGMDFEEAKFAKEKINWINSLLKNK